MKQLDIDFIFVEREEKKRIVFYLLFLSESKINFVKMSSYFAKNDKKFIF